MDVAASQHTHSSYSAAPRLVSQREDRGRNRDLCVIMWSFCCTFPSLSLNCKFQSASRSPCLLSLSFSVQLVACYRLSSPTQPFFSFTNCTCQDQHSALTLSTWLQTAESWSMCSCQRLHSSREGRQKRQQIWPGSLCCFSFAFQLFEVKWRL